MEYVRFVKEDTTKKSRQSAENQAIHLMKKTGEKVYKIIYLGESMNFIIPLKDEGILERSKPCWEIIDKNKFLTEVEKNSSLKVVDSFIGDQLEGSSGIPDISKKMEQKKVLEDANGREFTSIHKQEKTNAVNTCKYKECLTCKHIGFALLNREKTQTQLAEELGVEQQAISQHINNHFPSGIIQGKTRGAYCKLTMELKEYFTDLKDKEESEVITERKLRNMRYDTFTDAIFWSAIVLIEDKISVEDLRLSLNGMTDGKDIKKSLVNVFRVLTVDKIIEIGSEEDVWSKGKKTKKWKAFTSERIHRINEENIDQISSKRVRLIDEKKLKEYHLLGILINAVRGRSNLLEYWMEIFLDAFIERTEQLETKAMKNANELKNTDDFTDEDMEKTLLLLKAIKGELFNVGFLGRYMDPNNPTGVYFRDVNEINEFLDKIGAEFEYIVSNPGEKPYLQHKITPNDTV